MNRPAGLFSDAPYPGYAGVGPSPAGNAPLHRPADATLPYGPSRLPGEGAPAARPRLRDLLPKQAAAPKSPRRDRFAKWHVAQPSEQESEGWLLPYLDVFTLLLALLVALLAFTRAEIDRRDTTPVENAEPAPVRLVGSIGTAGLPDVRLFGDLDLPAIAAAWAAPAGETAEPAVAHGPATEPASPGAAVRVPVPQGTSEAAAKPGIGGTDAARPAAGPASDTADATDGSAPAAPPEPAEPASAPPSIADLGLDELGDSVDIIVNEQSISFRISAELLFPSGQAELGQQGVDVLKRLADVINRTDYRVSVEGHSDSVPIRNGRYPSNWELSAARAASVLRQLERHGVASSRLSATGYAHTRPIASNGSAAGRAANRRVELIMETGVSRLQPAPGQAAATFGHPAKPVATDDVPGPGRPPDTDPSS